ncbi:hypothetical protein G6514_009960 [Epicoccum nigrum]|nr:hypothetical protein G6514_009960 [Epicoccum nigrum]
MHFSSFFALLSALSLPTLLPLARASLLTSNHPSFAGFNLPQLQFLAPASRDATILSTVQTGARTIRLFIRPDALHTDPEPQLGEFDKSLLDQLDDALAAIHRISNGTVKVIIAPHDANALKGAEGVPCDAYCEKISGAYLDFYSNEEIVKVYKERLDVFFSHYTSKNFGGRRWGELSEVIMGVDIQHQPFNPIFPIPAGEAWLCDVASHLKALLNPDIAVVSGGVSGLQSLDRFENFPDSVFNCKDIDVIGIHGRFEREEGKKTAGTPWAEMFVPGNTLMGRAEKKGKLLMVEEWGVEGSVEKKEEDIFDHGAALNLRGIPWLFSPRTTNPFTSRALSAVLARTYASRSHRNWTSYLPAPSTILPPLTSLPPNPFIPATRVCTFGCPGHLCSAADDCTPDLLCMNNVCLPNPEGQPGQMGARCDSKNKCQTHLRCEGGRCGECVARPSLPDEKTGIVPAAHDLMGMCALDAPASPPVCSSPSSSPAAAAADTHPAGLRSLAGIGNPCTTPLHCPYTAYCSQSLACAPCLPPDSCLGSPCASSNACLTGYCNAHGRCDYAGLQRKKHFGVGLPGMGGKKRRVPGVPKGHERGPAKVRSEAMRVVVPEETVSATGVAGAAGVRGAS